MKEHIQALISQLEHNPGKQDIIDQLEELLTGDDIEVHADAVRRVLAEGRQQMIARGRFRVAVTLYGLELVLADSPAEEAALLKGCGTVLDEELFEQRDALEKFERAATLQPEDSELAEKIEMIVAERSRYEDVVNTFREQAASAEDLSLKAHMLFSAAERLYKNAPDHEDIHPLVTAALDADENHHRAARLLERIFEDTEDWTSLANMYQRMARVRKGKNDRVQMFLAAGYTYAYRLDDKEQAARCYAEVLDYQPGHPAALRFLVDYYEENQDWDHLVAVYEDTLHGKLSPDEEVAACMQAGMVHWRYRNDMEEAQRFFRRLSKLAPAHPGMIEFYRSYVEQTGDTLLLIRVIENALRGVSDPNRKEELTRELAQLSSSAGQNVEKAIDAWKKVLRQEPTNGEAIDELKKLYRHSGKWNNLIDLLKTEMDAIDDDAVDEKVSKYLEMIDIYRDELSMDMMVVKTYHLVLKLQPHNTKALDALASLYESAGRWSDLIKVLTARAEVAESDDQKTFFLGRVATLWVERFNNFNKAIDPLEAILEICPGDVSAMAQLKDIYAKRRAWKPLFELLGRECELVDHEGRTDILEQMADLAAEKMGDHARAIELLWTLYEIDPSDTAPLLKLEKQAERSKDWESVARAVAIRVDETQDLEQKSALISRLGSVYKERMKDPNRAAEAWKQLLEIDPGNAKAMRSLKEAYQDAGDWDALEALYAGVGDYETLVEVLGIAADRIVDTDTKIALSFRCADIYNDHIGQPERALRHYERVLSVDDTNQRAAGALIPLYRNAQKWSRLMGVLEISLAGTTESAERREIMEELCDLAANRINNRELAYQWAARVFEENANDSEVQARLETYAERAGMFEPLVALYKRHLENFDGDDRMEMERKIAEISLEKLGNVDDAILQYQMVLEENDTDENALLALDAIYRSTGQWDELEKVFERRIENADSDESRKAIMLDMAKMYEEGMDDLERAAGRYRMVLSEFPKDEDTLVSLERLYQMSEQWRELCGILEQQREQLWQGETGDAESLWREKSYQLATVVLDKLMDADRGIAIYRDVLDRCPQDADSIEALDVFLRDEAHQYAVAVILKPHLMEMGDWRRLAWVLSIIIENTPSVADKVALKVQLAEVYSTRLDDERLAFETLSSAMKDDPNDTSLWDRAAGLAETLDLREALGELYCAVFDSETIDDSIRMELAKRITVLYDRELGMNARSEPYHRYILEEVPDAVESFDALDQYYTAMEKWDALLALYYSARENHSYAGGYLELLQKICFVVYEVQRDVPAAISAYEEMLAADAQNEEANRHLVMLYEEAERWEQLADLLQDQMLNVHVDDVVSTRLHLGEVLELKLDKKEDALDCYQQSLADDPDNLKVQHALERLLSDDAIRLRAARLLVETYERQGAAEPLVRALEILLEDRDLETVDRVEIYRRSAEIKEGRLDNPRGAFDDLSVALIEDPENETVFAEVSRLAEEHDYYQAYCILLEQVVSELDDDIHLPRVLLALANCYYTAVGDEAKAEQTFMRLLKHAPDNPDTALPAIEALDAIFSTSERFAALQGILRSKVDVLMDDREQRQVLHRMAATEESVLERPEEAIALYREILDIDESDTAALVGLERLYQERENWPSLVEVLRCQAVYASADSERRERLMRAGRIIEKDIGDVAQAIDAYVQVGDDVGADLASLSALERLYESAQRWEDLRDCVEAQLPLAEDDETRAQVHFKLGDLFRTRLRDADDAVMQYGLAFQMVPGHTDTRAALEQMLDSEARKGAIELLKPLAEAEGDSQKLVDYLELEARDADDPLEKSNLYKQAAETAYLGLDDSEKAFALYLLAIENGAASEDLETVLDRGEQLAAEVSGFDKLVSAYTQLAPDVLDGQLQSRCYLKVAQLSNDYLDDEETAREYYLKLLDGDEFSDVAMNALEKIYRANEAYLELFEIYRQKVSNTYDDEARKDVLFKQAVLCREKLDDVSGAVQTYESILELDPVNRRAVEGLEELYPLEERWSDLVDLLEQRRDQEPEHFVDLSFRLGKIVHDNLGDEDRSFVYFKEALDDDMEYAPVIELLESYMADDRQRSMVAEILEPVYAHRGNWEQLVEVLEAQLENVDDPMDRKALLKRIGTLFEEQLGNLEQAFATFSRMFREAPDDISSRDLLMRLAGVLENWEALADVFETALEDVVGDTPETAEVAFVLGDLYENRLDDPAKAKVAYKRVLSFAPDDERAFDAVERMLLITESWSELLELYRDAADAAMDLSRQKGFLYKMADIYEERLQDADAAINVCREVLDLDDRDDVATNTLDRLYFQHERFEDLADHFRNQIDLAQETVSRNALRRELAGLMEEHLDDGPGAVDLYEEAINEPEGDNASLAQLERLIMVEALRERISDILEPIYREADEWKKLVVILQTQLDYLESPLDRVDKLKEIGFLHENRGPNHLLAFRAYAQGFLDDPENRECFDEMYRLARVVDNWEEFAQNIATAIDGVSDADFKKELLGLLGNTYDEKLDMPRKAISCYRRVLEIDEMDMDALCALEGLFNLVGDWDGLVDVLEQKAEYLPDPVEQCELFRSRAAIQEELLGNSDAAIDSYVKAMEADPQSVPTMEALDRLYELKEKWEDLVEIRRARLEVEADAARRKQICASMAGVFEDRLDDSFEAISAWKRVLDADPEDMDAILSLDRLYTRDGNYQELLDNLVLQKELSRDQAEWVELSMRIGDLQRSELADEVHAIETYRDVLSQQPTHKEAISRLESMADDEGVRMQVIDVLEPLHREAGRYEKLADILELKLELIMEPGERMPILMELAELFESGLSDPQKGFDAYVRALKEVPTNQDIQGRLERIAATEDMYGALCDVYDNLCDDLYDPAAEKELLLKIGNIKEGQLGDAKGAIAAYRRIFDNGDTSTVVLNALDRLYERMEMWSELEEILEQEIATADEMDAINRFKLRQALMREQHFEDVSGAIMIYRDVAEASPENDECIAALETLLTHPEVVIEVADVLAPAYEVRGEQHKITRLIESRLKVAEDDIDKLGLYRELAVHQEQVLLDTGAAFDALIQAFALSPEDPELMSELERLAEIGGSWSALVNHAEQILSTASLEPDAKISIGLKVAEWAYSQVGDPQKAEQMYKGVLEQDGEHQGALAALVDLFTGLGRFEELLPVLQTQATVALDYDRKKDILFNAAQISHLELNDLDRAVGYYRQVLELDDADMKALDAMIDLLQEKEDYAALVDALQTRAEFTGDLGLSNQYRHRAATLYMGPIQDADKGIDLYRQIVEMDPSDGNALDMLESAFVDQKKWEELQDIYQLKLDNAQTDDGRMAVLRQMAKLCEDRLNAPEDAIEKWRDVLIYVPEDSQAVASLERIYTRLENWVELVELLEDQANRKASGGDGAAELALLVKIGEISMDRLDDPARATEIYERVLDRDPAHTRALAALARLYEADGEWDKVSEVLHTAAESASGGPDEAEVHYRLALLARDRQDDEDGAVASLRRAVALDAGHLEANRTLVDISRARGDYQGVLEGLIREEQHLETDTDKFEKLMEIAQIQGEHLKDAAGAVDTLERAYEIDRSNTQVLLLLSDAYIDAGRQDDAIPVLRDLVEAETAGGKRRSKQASVYLARLARAYLARGDQDEALDALEKAYKMDISNIEVLVQLGRLHFERDELDQAAKLFRALLLQRFDNVGGITKADIYCYVGEIQLKQGEPRKAKGMFRRGLDENRDHPGCIAGMEKC